MVHLFTISCVLTIFKKGFIILSVSMFLKNHRCNLVKYAIIVNIIRFYLKEQFVNEIDIKDEKKSNFENWVIVNYF